MGNPANITGAKHLSDANHLSRSFASLLPVQADEVGFFLSVAAFAIGGREADLARMLGVSRATLSGWKSRGSIPEKYRHWFIDAFPLAVLSNRKNGPGDDFGHVGIAAALQLLRSTAFNPFGLTGLGDAELLDVANRHFGGLVRLSHFVQLQLPDAIELAAEDRLYERVAEVVTEACRKAAASLFPRQLVSQ